MGSSRIAWRVVLGYAAVSSAWVVLSDQLARYIERATGDVQLHFILELSKGLVFVFVTSSLLYVLVHRQVGQILRSRRKFEAIVACMADGMVLIDRSSRVVEANRAALQLFGLQRRSEIMRPLAALKEEFSFRVPSLGGGMARGMACDEALSGRRVANLEAVIRSRDGKEVTLGISAAPVWLEERKGTSPYVAVILRDMTELRQLQRLREEFLSTAAHEFKTPLTVVKANTQLLLRHLAAWPQERSLGILRMIDGQCDRLNRLTQELLENSRLGGGRLTLRKDRVELGALIQSVVERMRPVSARHPIALERRGDLFVAGDAARLEQVILNLLDNAIKFSPGGGGIEVRVTGDERAGRARVEVRDHGIGIPTGARDRVFEKYYSALQGPFTDLGGVGIGLNLCRELVRGHGGDMGFRAAEGGGTTFSFWLPLEKGERHGRAAA